LIACYSYIDGSGNAIGIGVFSTTDDGAHWTNRGNVDTTTFVQFVSYGDVTYGLSYFDGVFVFTTGASGVTEPHLLVSAGYALEQNTPNPFSTTTTIRYVIPHNEH